MDETGSIVPRLQTLYGFGIILARAGEAFNRTLSRTTLEGLLSERCARSWTEIQNCSQKDLQFRASPSNVGTSSLGSLTPLLSDGRVEVSTGADAEDNDFLILTEQSNTWLSSVSCSPKSSSESSRSIRCRSSRVLTRSLFMSFVLSSYCRSRHVSKGAADVSPMIEVSDL